MDVNERSGIYFLPTSISGSEKILWDAYNTIREVESIISDLDLRPIYHKKDKSSLAHLNLELLAYRIANTVRHQLKMNTLPVGAANNADKLPEDNSIHDERREIVRTINTQKSGHHNRPE